MPTAKLCFMLDEMAFASQVRTRSSVMTTKTNAADEHRAEPQLPADAHRGQAERDERVLAHVRRDRERPVGVQAHQQRSRTPRPGSWPRCSARPASRRTAGSRG